VSLEPGSPEWQRLVTPSKIAGILGISPWADQFTTWHQMAGNLPPVAQTEAMRRGTFHEEGVLREFFHRNPWLTRIPDSAKTVKNHDWVAATPDALAKVNALDNWGGSGDLVLVEAKTASRWDEWGEPGTDQIPEYYRAQVITTAHLLGCEAIHVPVVGPFWDYREYAVQPDPELAEAILARCRAFWESVQSGEEPELSQTVASYTTWTKVADPGAADGDVEIPADVAHRFLTAVAAEKDVKPAKAAIVNLLERANARRATYNGQPVATRQKSAHGMSLIAARKPPVIELENAS
jgi:predicted phage-related endonuclease